MFLNAEAWVQHQRTVNMLFVSTVVLRELFLRYSSVFHFQYYSTNDPYPCFSIITLTPYELGN